MRQKCRMPLSHLNGGIYKMNIKKRMTAFVCMCLILILSVLAALSVTAATGPTLSTTLTDHLVQRGSKKTFDVWARNASGNKIKAIVKLNGQKLEPTWDDNEKTSYTLIFTQEGENIVSVSASSDGGKKKELTYHITYCKAAEGDAIGTAVWSIETFTLGCGYLIYPLEVPIYEGETAAEQLIRLLHENGFVGYYGGDVKKSFYLAYIADGTASGERYNTYRKSGVPNVPRQLNLFPSIPSLLVPHLRDTMTFFDPEDYTKNWIGYLGEFAITNGSGWMYCVNNVFPNVGFADCYLSDGDVVRVQFTLGYGADIGGGSAMGNSGNAMSGSYYSTANKDVLTKAISSARTSGFLSRSNVKAAYDNALKVAATLDAAQDKIDAAANALQNALASPSPDKTEDEDNSGNTDYIPRETDRISDTADGAHRETDASASADDPKLTSTPENTNTSDSFAISERGTVTAANKIDTASGQTKTDTLSGKSFSTTAVIGASVIICIVALIAVGLIIRIRKKEKNSTHVDRGGKSDG